MVRNGPKPRTAHIVAQNPIPRAPSSTATPAFCGFHTFEWPRRPPGCMAVCGSAPSYPSYLCLIRQTLAVSPKEENAQRWHRCNQFLHLHPRGQWPTYGGARGAGSCQCWNPLMQAKHALCVNECRGYGAVVCMCLRVGGWVGGFV